MTVTELLPTELAAEMGGQPEEEKKTSTTALTPASYGLGTVGLGLRDTCADVIDANASVPHFLPLKSLRDHLQVDRLIPPNNLHLLCNSTSAQFPGCPKVFNIQSDTLSGRGVQWLTRISSCHPCLRMTEWSAQRKVNSEGKDTTKLKARGNGE